MKQNRNRSRDLGFYLLMLAILIAVLMLLTKQTTPNQIESYSEMAELFRTGRVKSFRVIPGSAGSTVELEIRPKSAAISPEGTEEPAAAGEESASPAQQSEASAEKPAEQGTGAQSPESQDGASEEMTVKVTYELYNFSVFYEDFHELIWEQSNAGIIESYEYEPGGNIP